MVGVWNASSLGYNAKAVLPVKRLSHREGVCSYILKLFCAMQVKTTKLPLCNYSKKKKEIVPLEDISISPDTTAQFLFNLLFLRRTWGTSKSHLKYSLCFAFYLLWVRWLPVISLLLTYYFIYVFFSCIISSYFP